MTPHLFQLYCLNLFIYIYIAFICASLSKGTQHYIIYTCDYVHLHNTYISRLH